MTAEHHRRLSRNGTEKLPVGKIPPELLTRILAGMPRDVPGVLVGPAMGEDAAILDIGGRLMAIAADPITFSTPRPGWYAVHVNANDAAVMGATPEYFLLTLLLPPGTSGPDVERIMAGEPRHPN